MQREPYEGVRSRSRPARGDSCPCPGFSFLSIAHLELFSSADEGEVRSDANLGGEGSAASCGRGGQAPRAGSGPGG